MTFKTVASCCDTAAPHETAAMGCPSCGRPGKAVERVTPMALLRPGALARMAAPEHQFCSSAGCPIVYFGRGETFERTEITVPVFQKEPHGDRTVCYCFNVSERDLRLEIDATGRSATAERINDLVRAGRCACEVRNPQGSCCLGNVSAVVKAAKTGVEVDADSVVS